MALKNKKDIRKTRRRSDGIIGTALSFLIMFPMLVMMLPTVVFMFLSMLPTLVSLLMSRNSNEKYKWMCIGGANFAGALYFLFKLWFDAASVSQAVFVFFQVKTILVTYGAAAVGFFIYKIVPLFVINFQTLSDQHRLVFLRNKQKSLIEQWGAEVSETETPSSFAKKNN